MPTATTVPLLLLVMVLWRVTKGELLSIVLFLSIFQAASAVNIGSMGVAPWIVTLVVGLFIKAARRSHGLNTVGNLNTAAVRLLCAFVCYAVVSGVLYPLIFHGVLVQGSHDITPSPLSLGMANIAQICYLLAAVVLFGMALLSSRETISAALDWYVRGCVVASFLALYQLANATTGLPYPGPVFYSNPKYVIYPAYMINGMWRLNSTFTEASSMAGHLSVGIALLGWNVMTRPLRWSSSLSLVLMISMLMMTLSSSGYISMIVILLAASVLSVRAIFRAQSLSRVKAILLLCVAFAGTVILATTSAAATIDKAVHSVLLDKEDTSSYRERMASNTAAIETAKDTYYMGAGWGSVRCSSLGAGMLATVGALGVLLFCAFLFSLVLPFFAPGYHSRFGDVYEKSLFGILVILASMMVSSNEPDQPILWVLFASACAGPTAYRAIKSKFQNYQGLSVLQRPEHSL